MLYLSKSKYCSLWQCPKLLWLNKFKPEEKTEDPALQARFDEGNVVGDLAMGLFGDFIEVTAFKEDGKLDLDEMMRLTQQYIDEGVENICEASFSYNGLYCAVDILRKDGDGYAIYEVKSSSHEKYIYGVDIAYQKYVLEHCGVNVTGTYLVCINNDYILGDHLELDKLFKIFDMSETVAIEIQNVPSLLRRGEVVMSSETEPDIDIGAYCRDPYKCAFWKYCTKHLPSPNGFDLYKVNFKKMVEYYRQGLISYEDLLNSGKIKNEKQIRQMTFELAKSEPAPYIDKDGIRDFLDTISYPLYFLDFESMKPVIPIYKGTKPNQQVAFQYSLHYIEHKGGELKHKEFLAESGVDPCRAIAERLCEDIPMDACIAVYYQGFERGRLGELAEMFPDLATHLLNIRDHVVDFLKPFQSGYYYNKAMGGSFSIKVVLPALFPNDPELDYHSLEGVHNGTEAMTIFPKIKDMSPEEQEKARHNLLKYCELDTYAMVKLWEELERVAE